MTPGTRVRIHYPGDCKHNAIGRVDAVRKVGSMKEHTILLEKPIRITGCKPIWKVYVTASRLRPIAEDPDREPQVMWTAAPQRARVSAKKASPAPVKVVKPVAIVTRFDDAITMAEAARLIGVNRQTVKNMIVRGELQGYQQGKRRTWHVSRAAVERLAETYQDGRQVRKPRHSRGLKKTYRKLTATQVKDIRKRWDALVADGSRTQTFVKLAATEYDVSETTIRHIGRRLRYTWVTS